MKNLNENEYNSYYKVEYSTFFKYLENTFFLSDEILSKIENALLLQCSIGYIVPCSDYLIDSIFEFDEDKFMLKILYPFLLEPKEFYNEIKNGVYYQ